MAARRKYRVVDSTQVHHEGATYAGGDPLPADVDQALIDYWLHAGWIEQG